MIVVEKVDIRINLVNSSIWNTLKKFAKEKYNLTDLNVIDKAFEDWKENRKPDWDIKDANQKDFTYIMKDNDILEQEFGKYFKDAINSEGEEDKSTEDSKEDDKSTEDKPEDKPEDIPASGLEEEFMKALLSENPQDDVIKQIKQKGIGKDKSVYQQIRAALAKGNWLKKLNTTKAMGVIKDWDKPIEPKFIQGFGDMIFGKDKETYKVLIKNFVGKFISNGNKAAEILDNYDSSFLQKWVTAMAASLPDDKNIFYYILTLDGAKNILGGDGGNPDRFSSCFNICSGLENDGNFRKYLEVYGRNQSDKPLQQAIIFNPNLYKNVPADRDKVALAKYNSDNLDKTRMVNAAINNNAWKNIAEQTKETTLGKKKKNKYSTYKSPSEAVKKFKAEVDSSEPEKLKTSFKDLLGIELTDNQLEKLITKLAED